MSVASQALLDRKCCRTTEMVDFRSSMSGEVKILQKKGPPIRAAPSPLSGSFPSRYPTKSLLVVRGDRERPRVGPVLRRRSERDRAADRESHAGGGAVRAEVDRRRSIGGEGKGARARQVERRAIDRDHRIVGADQLVLGGQRRAGAGQHDAR